MLTGSLNDMSFVRTRPTTRGGAFGIPQHMAGIFYYLQSLKEQIEDSDMPKPVRFMWIKQLDKAQSFDSLEKAKLYYAAANRAYQKYLNKDKA